MPQHHEPVADSEQARLEALRRYDILDTAPEHSYDDVTRLAAGICNTPIALIALIDENRQWFKSRVGLGLRETAREVAFCAHAIEHPAVMQVPDTSLDERFRDNPLVTGPPQIVFYAGAPLITPDGFGIGTVCVIDHEPRTLSQRQLEALEALANQVVANLELRRALKLAQQYQAVLAEEVEFRESAEAARRLSDSFMRSTIDSLRDNIAIIDSRGEIVHVNRAWSKFAEENSAPETVADTGPGSNYLEVCDRAAADGSHEAAEVARVLRLTLEDGGSNGFSLEYPCHSPGEQRWFVVQISAFSTGADRHAVVTHRNVTRRRLATEQVLALNRDLERRVAARTAELERTNETLQAAERTLKEQAVMLQRAEQLACIGSWQYAFADGSVRCSAGLEQIVGRRLGENGATLQDLLALLDEQEQQKLRDLIETVAGDGQPGRTRCRVARPDGSIRHVQTSIDVIRNADGEIYGVIGACLDVTDMDRTLEQLTNSETRLRALTMRLERIREDERVSISREIHDELGQMLTALKIDLTLLARDVVGETGARPPDAEIRRTLESMEQLVDATISSVRTIAMHLRPELLDSFGLIPAIEWHATEFEQRTKIHCIVEGRNVELAPDVRSALFRIVQEAMTNVARHAGADNVQISIRRDGEHVELSIADDGRGVTEAELEGSGSLGVLGMRERAAMVGGSVEIHGEPGRGTVVTVRLTVPVHDAGNAAGSGRA